MGKLSTGRSSGTGSSGKSSSVRRGSPRWDDQGELGPEPVRVLLFSFPDWPLAAIRLGQASGDRAGEAPLIVVKGGAVVVRCRQAAAEGVTIGLRIREAQLRCPSAVICEHDESIDETTFEVVLRAVAEVAPDVHVIRPGVAAIRSRGPARFYGGEEAAAATLLQRLTDFATPDSRPAVAIADGVFAAEQAAIRRRGWTVVPPGRSAAMLSGVAVEALGQPELARQLRQLGIRTLGEFAALPRADVHARFGAVGRRQHQRAGGEDLVMLRSHNPASDRSLDVDLDAANAEEVIAACTPGLRELIGGLAAESLIMTEVRIRISTERRRDDRLWRHPWHFDADELVNRLHWQLRDLGASSPFTDDPVISDRVSGMQLIPVKIAPAHTASQGLWGSRPEGKVIKVLTGLQDRLGYREVRTAVPQGGRLAKDRRVWVPFGTAPNLEREPSQPWPGRVPGPPPVTVFERPLAVRLLDHVGRSVRVDERGNLSADPALLSLDPHDSPRQIIAWAGPWPATTRWWLSSAQPKTAVGTVSPGRPAATNCSALASPTSPPDRIDRFQVVDETQHAWLLAAVGDSCWAEAGYQ